MVDNMQPWPQQRQGFRPSPPGMQRTPFSGVSQPGASAAPGISSLTREERQEAKRIAEEASFSFAGYQVVRREFISHRFDPRVPVTPCAGVSSKETNARAARSPAGPLPRSSMT